MKVTWKAYVKGNFSRRTQLLSEISVPNSPTASSISASELYRLETLTNSLEIALAACQKQVESYISELPVGNSGLTERDLFIDFFTTAKPRYIEDINS